MLPDIDGYSICKIMRGQSDVPIIMLTGLHNEESEIKGFELGIDDYITKPFHYTVFIKRRGCIKKGKERRKQKSQLYYNSMN